VSSVLTAAAHPIRDHCLAPDRPIDAPLAPVEGRYGRAFPDLPPLESDPAELLALGASGGLCDAGPGTDGAADAGWPFLGQFIAHDITADRSPIGPQEDAESIANFRSPRANLECVYGAGPVGSPYLYERDDPARLLLGDGGHDVPRNSQGLALVADPRNDVHLFMNQLQVGYLHAHNLLVRRLREDGGPEATVFDDARMALTWHHQWILLNDFLPTLIGDELTGALLRDGATLYRVEGEPYIPFEFADAAYRYGHSQVRNLYRINSEQPERPLFPDLIGFRPVGVERTIDWALFFDVGGRPAAQRSKPIDGCLPESLINLPIEISGPVDDAAFSSLAGRDLQRGQSTGLPSGEAVARALTVEPLTPEEVGLAEHGWEGETPLWYYVLREASERHGGDRLGEVGGRIVGEVLVGIVDYDPLSYRSVEPSWRPTLPSADPARYTLIDLLRAPELEDG
jgi:hypothetical protein